MQFDIPMRTKGVMDLNALDSIGQTLASPTRPQSNMNTGVVHNTTPVSQYNTNNSSQLKKGQKISLGRDLKSIKVCLGWDVINTACDLDASAFMLGANNKVIGDDWFIFYGKTTSPDGSVVHSGDSNGVGSGDDEIITINLQNINPNVQKIVFVVTIDEALTRHLNFSMVSNAYVRVLDATNKELVRFTLSDYYSNVTSMMVGAVYKHNNEWKFNAIGDGVAKDLAGLCLMYGVDVAD